MNILDDYFQRFCALDKSPTQLTKLIWHLRSVINPDWALKDKEHLERFVSANSLPASSDLEPKKCPEIQILIVCKSTDSDLLSSCIFQACKKSENPVSLVSIIVPKDEIDQISSLLSPLDLGVEVEILSEDDFVSSYAKNLILDNRPDRFGWILQQILVCNFLLTTQAQNVLVVDADTLILRKQIWVDKNERQILMQSLEFHKPYYDFLTNQSEIFGSPKASYISHHMLFQTKYFRQMMKLWGVDADQLLKRALSFSHEAEASPFDLKYEPYAQYMLSNHRSRIHLSKWSNISLKKSTIIDLFDPMDAQSGLLDGYNSLSLHHWS